VALLVALIIPIALLFVSGCESTIQSVVDPLKGNQPYASEEGDEPMDLREGKPVYIWPVASPDGKRIAFVSSRDGNTELYAMNADGSNPVNLTRNRAEDGDGSYAWSPDGARIVFSSRRSGHWNIYTVTPEGRDLRRVTISAAQDYNPVWSPDGQWLAFASNRSGTWQIYRVHPDGAGLESLTSSPRDNDAPVYSPDGRFLAFISDRKGSWDIFRIPSDGGAAVALADYPSDEDHPRWSSDGQRIIFESNKDGHWDVYTMRSDGSDLVRLTRTPAAESSPVFSPDMRHVAFASYRDGNPEIYVMNSDGSDQTRLTFNPANDICPYWSSDGAMIYFSSNRGGRDEIYAIRMSDYREIAVSAPSGEEGSHGTGGYFEEHPVWSEDGRRITFAAGRDQNREWYVIDLLTGRIEPADPGSAMARMNVPASANNASSMPPDAVLSHDRSRIAFESDRDGNWEIYVAAPDGSDAVRLTTAPGADIQPAWSPDDRRIAFTSHRDGDSAIYVMDRDGRNVKLLVQYPSARLPAWSPDGASLYFVSERNGHDELYRKIVGTGETVSLTPSIGRNGTQIWHPTVSPDGRWLAYVTNVTGEYRVWISDLNGAQKRVLTHARMVQP
jgi:Tol biopolymer transport system component